MYDEGHREEAEDEGPDDALSGFLRGDAMCEGVPSEETAEEEASIVCLPRYAEKQGNIPRTRKLYQS